MKKLLLTGLLLVSCLAMQAQHECTIEGHAKGLKDGTVVTLFLTDGRVGSSVANDTVQNEKFRFKRKVEEGVVEQLSLHCHSEEFPSMSLKLYGASDAKIKVTGLDNLIYTWQVDSPVKEQQEMNRFIEESREQWNEFQRQLIKMNSMRSAPESEKKELRSVQDSIMAIINQREMVLMQKSPISAVWMDQLHGLCMAAKYNPKFSHREETVALYNRLSEEEKNSGIGQEITVNLFPPTIVKEGEAMADADLFDLEGKMHHLADFKGKYLLLDFWSSGCGPCIMALPEMREIQEKYSSQLTIISLSSDTKSRWKAASVEHKMTWPNLSDLKQTAGLYAKYGIRGIPNYVLISPEGKIMKMWAGYGNGSLQLKMRRYLDSPKREMTVSQQGNTKIVTYPEEKSSNTEIIEIKQVELSDTATIIRCKAYHIPKYWIRLSPKVSLISDTATSCALKKAEGITPGEHFFLPESGEAEITLTFEPLPMNALSFDFTEGTKEGDWQIKGLKLSK